MLTAEMKRLITAHTAGMVASVNDDGSPSVSPKATFVIIDDGAIAFGNIRSPGTAANLRKRPTVEVCFIDVLMRKAVRVTGMARIISKADASPELTNLFQETWADYLPMMTSFVQVDIVAAAMILSPAYDLGFSEDELRHANLAKLNAL